MANQPMKKDNPLKGKKSGKWTKYGGEVFGLVKKEITSIWYCQMCGAENPPELKPFLFEMAPGEYIRLCSDCTFKTKRIKKIKPQERYVRLITIVKKTTLY